MYQDISKKITEAFEKSEKSISGLEIDASRFHAINKYPNAKVAYIDGGNAEIIGTSGFSLALVRIGCSVFSGTKKISSEKVEFFAFSSAFEKDGSVNYSATPFNPGLDLPVVEMDSYDISLSSGSNRAELKSMSNVSRRSAELKLAEQVACQKKAEVIVMDGNLSESYTVERGMLGSLMKTCISRNIVLSSVSKTNSVFAPDGVPFSVMLDRKGSSNGLHEWYFMDYGSGDSKIISGFAKLHKSSRHVFKMDFLAEQISSAEMAISNISGNSCDPIFFGYPYGLIDADRIARVSNSEKSYLKSVILSSIKNKDIERYLSSTDAHDILDRISF